MMSLALGPILGTRILLHTNLSVEGHVILPVATDESELA